METIKRYILSQVEQKKLSQGEAYAMLKEMAAASSRKKQEIAVIGMACILPEADNYHEFWENLKAGRDCLGYMPEEYTNGDGLHLNPNSFGIVINYIRTHGYQ